LSVTSAASASPGTYAYIANQGNNNVSIINTVNNTVITTVNVGTAPYGVAFSPDKTKVYITNHGSGTVSVIDTLTNNVTNTINVGSSPEGVVATPDGTKVYVANWDNNNVTVINTATNTVTATVNVGIRPRGISVTPDGTKVYVANWGSNTVSVINTSNNTVTSTVNIGTYPEGLAVTPDGTKVYAASGSSSHIYVIDTATNQVTATVPVGVYPIGVTVSPDGTTVYVPNWASNTVSVINTANNTVIATVPVGNGPWGSSVTPDGTKVYVANSNSNTISVINTSNNTVTSTINVGSQPFDLGQFIVSSSVPVPVLPAADFSTNVTNGHAPLSVQFTDLSENAAVLNWDFGDGANSTEQNPAHTYSAAGIYTVNLTATNANGTNSTTGTITVSEEPVLVLPVANFSTNVSSGYVPLDVQFNDSSDNATEWYWDFGDGANSTEQNPMHTYSTVGSYNVVLTVTNANGTNVSDSQPVTAIEPLMPIANFSSNVTSGYAPLNVQFNDSSENATSLYWDFGDGANSTEQNLMHIFFAPGNFTVNLTASNANGTSSSLATINVLNANCSIMKTVTDVAGQGPRGNVTAAGDIISYEINVNNTAGIPLTNVTVTDPMLGGILNVTNLGIGSNETLYGNYIVTKTDIATNGNWTGFIINNATVYSDQLDPENATVTVSIEYGHGPNPIGHNPHYSIFKTVINPDPDGDCIINNVRDKVPYRIVVQNDGDMDLTNVVVNDPMISLEGPIGDYKNNGVLHPGETWEYNGIYELTREDVARGKIENIATVSCDQLPDKSVKVDTPVEQNTDLSIYKSVTGIDENGDHMINNPGDVINYQVIVKNNGNMDLTGISVSDPMVDLTKVGVDQTDSGVLALGETWTYKSDYTATESDINSDGDGTGFITNTATVHCNELPDKSSSIEVPISKTNTQISENNESNLPVANFSTSVTSGYAPLTVQFTDHSQNSVAWSWDFNSDGVVDSTTMSPSYTYTTPGTYVAKLIVSNANGAVSQPATLTINIIQTTSSSGGGSSGGSGGSAKVVTSSSSSTVNTTAVPSVTPTQTNTLVPEQTVTPANVQTPEPINNTSIPAKQKSPGFEIFGGLIGLLGAVYLNRRK
jgi:uncharacterized repeat protein (TIGR01451 family)